MFDFKLKNYNFAILFICLTLNALGLVFINSSLLGQTGSFMSQFSISIASLVLCIMISFLNLRYVLSRPLIFFVIGIISLVLVRITGTAFGRNSVRWIQIPIINMQLQPSEFVKLFVIVYISQVIEKLDTQINQFGNLMKVVGIYAIPFILIFIQPNLSNSLILTFIFVSILFASKLKAKWFLIGGAIAGLIVTLVLVSVKFGFIENMPFLQDYQKNRIISFFEPEGKDVGTYQQENSVIAIGSGKVVGKGINNNSPNSVKNGNWLAESQNDFIFAIVGEEIGFLGSLILLGLYAALILMIISIASRQRSYFYNLVAIGIASWIGTQTFVNIGVATSMIPNTGVPLPFFSQGGSSLMSIYMAIGLIINIGREVKY